MISDYYHRQYSLQQQNTKAIKLKANQLVLKPFVIPHEHFHPNQSQYELLKNKCECNLSLHSEIKSEFSFIKSEILRQHQRKKQKHQKYLASTRTLEDQENRQQAQKQIKLTCKKLVKLQQSRKLNIEQSMTQKSPKQKPPIFQPIMGQSVIFSPVKNSPSNTNLKLSRKSLAKSRFSLSSSQ